MSFDKPIRRIAVVGTGTIGASWAALYLARGFSVIATNPSAGAEADLRRYVETAWPEFSQLGLSPNASLDHLQFTTNLKQALSDADFVHENAPERRDLKIQLYAEMDAATPPDSIIASSSSGLKMSVMQSACKHPERCVTAHPFNPPHVIPLVEIVAGEKTSPEVVRLTMQFFTSIGKKPIHVRKEVVGHVANRLQAALWREVVYLIEQGVVDVGDADTAVCWGPGLRWGVMGPNLLFHLGGGEGGIRHFLDQFAEPYAAWWQDLGKLTDFTPEVKQKIIDGVIAEAGGRSLDELGRERDEVLLGLLKLRAGMESEAAG